MFKNQKIILGNGLAFSEEKDMKLLRTYSQKGYHFKKARYGFYILEKGEPKDYIYSIDYQSLNNDEFEEYNEIIEESDWELLQKYEYILFLRALPNTAPLYTDKPTLNSRENHLSTKLIRTIIGCISLILLCLLFKSFIIDSMINSKLISFLTYGLIGAMTGSTLILIVGVLNIKRKSKYFSK